MDREILFRAKRTDNNEWVEGHYAKCRGHYYILPVYDADHGFDERYADWVEVKKETVCQYTGLTDEDERKIFEGDIVLVDGENEYFVVGWDDDNAKFVLEGKGFNADFENYWGYEIEVIGNIFDSLELLEGTEE
ncbi:MAG: hypothetical protein HFH41_03960 [Lachnospiraceae bacterium]|nr:hypothetical protein [Lachnospiraceae bacterium]